MKKLLILTIVLLLLVSCSESTQTSQQNKTNVDGVNSDPGETTTAELQPDIPADSNFGGHDFRVLVRGEAYIEWQSQDIFVEEQNGEPVNDAVYMRNVYLEEKLNITISEVQENGDIAARARKSITSGSDDFDVVMANTSETSSLASQNYIYNLHNIPYLDLTKPWWDQRSVAQFSMGGKLYFITGDLSIMANDATWIIMFNKDLLNDFQLDNPYDLVLGNKWTFDKMLEMMEVVAADVDGDGKMFHETDRYGFATHTSSYEGFFFGSGSHIVSKDADDMPYLNMNTERLIGVIEKTHKLMANRDITLDISPIGLEPVKHLQPVFQRGGSLFFGEVVQCIIRLRAMEIDFGVLPFPKYDEMQEDYNHFIHLTASMVSIPLTNTELERTGIVLEAISSKSKYTLQPAYYEICLEGKFMRDNESVDMLDIIFATRNYDIGYVYSWGSLFSVFQSAAEKNSDFASKYATSETTANTAMGKLLDAWME